MKNLSTIVMLISITFLQSCGSTDLQSTASSIYSTPPIYSELEQNIFQPKCLGCHSSGVPNLSSYDTLMAGGKVVAGNPAASILYQQLEAGLMPTSGSPLSSIEIKAVYDWIANGALNNSNSGPPDMAIEPGAVATSQSSLLLSWTLPTQSVSEIKIERATNASGPFSAITSLTTALTSFTDGGLSAATTYYYQITLNNLSGSSPLSSVFSGTTMAYPPLSPSSLGATAISSSQIDLTWTDSSSDETGFILERSLISGGTYSFIAILSTNMTSYSDTSLSALTTYYYRVSATNSGGSSSASNSANATTTAVVTNPPVAPAALTASAISSSQINLNWTDNATTEDGFKIERSTSSVGTFNVIETLTANSTNYSDTTGLSASTTYYYKVYAYNAIGNSSSTTVANATTQATATNPPTAPSNLAANATSASQINISWTDNSTDESGFKIERSTSLAGPYSVVYTTLGNATNYQNTGLPSATTYYYRIYAYNGAGNSSTTTTVSATTLVSVPSTPTGLATVSTSSTQINLSWTDNATNETNYKVQRSTASGGPYTDIVTLNANVTSYSDSGLSVATSYYYRVYAINSGGNSNFSSIASAITWGTFAWINTNLIQSNANCISCHQNPGAKGTYDMSTYSNVMTRVVVGNAAASLLYTRCSDGTMPKGGPALTIGEVEAIRTWINSGAVQ
jgi:mono/diheme cytochrome c family protein